MKINTANGGSTSGKFIRVFETLDEIKTSLTRLETRDGRLKDPVNLAQILEIKRQVTEEIDDIKVKIEAIQKTLYQIVGKESVRSSIYGVVGAIVASVVTWLITIFCKGG